MGRKNGVLKKYTESNPTVIAIRRYEREIAELTIKYDKANEEHDWSMRNWYANQLAAKKNNLEILKEKLGKNRIILPSASDDW